MGGSPSFLRVRVGVSVRVRLKLLNVEVNCKCKITDVVTHTSKSEQILRWVYYKYSVCSTSTHKWKFTKVELWVWHVK